MRFSEMDPEDTCPVCDHEVKKHAPSCPPPLQPLPSRERNFPGRSHVVPPPDSPRPTRPIPAPGVSEAQDLLNRTVLDSETGRVVVILDTSGSNTPGDRS